MNIKFPCTLAAVALGSIFSMAAFGDSESSPNVSGSTAAQLENGAKIYTNCRACHSLDPNIRKTAPTLHGLFGRKSGTVKDYKYSEAMLNANVVWTEDTLNEFLKKPADYVPGTWMYFVGLNNQKDIDDVIAFLKENTK